MYTIYDYLKYYKDYSIKEKSWNMMDNLLCAILAYAPMKKFIGVKSLKEIHDEVIKVHVTVKDDFMAPKTQEIIKIINESVRYKDLKFKNFENIVNSKTQFGALTLTIKNIKVIAFEGTDKSIIGWQENFRLAYEYPTKTQELAINYLKKNINIFNRNVYVVGHSKGGNSAMVSAMGISNGKFKRIKQVINFDGPGFRKQELESAEYKKMSTKLINIVPESSVVGMLLYNKDYTVVTSSLRGILAHYPTSWNCYGENFVLGKLSKISKDLNVRTTKNLVNISEESIKEVFENIFKEYNDKNTSKVIISLREIIHLLKTIKSFDKQTTQYISQILSSMVMTRGLIRKKDDIEGL